MTIGRDKMVEAVTKIAGNDQAKQIGAVYKFVLGGSDGTWTFDLNDPPSVTETDGTAQCTVTLSGDDYASMLSGETNSQRLFFTGKLQIAGDVTLGMKLQKVIDLVK